MQHLIQSQGEAIWSWLSEGAVVYVCGDKNAMAPQVRETFIEIGVEYGGMDRAASTAMIDDWESTGRYCVDAY